MNKNYLLYLFFFIASSLFAVDKDKQALPTIQEAWVDAGYFTWNDSTKTSLQITALGAQHDTLPDVCDGEQLTSASRMFTILTNTTDTIALEKAPFFNTQNITDFSWMFFRCTSLTSIPLFDTSNGTNFASMFYGCNSLTAIPKFDFSKAYDVSRMFLNTKLE